VIPNVAEEHGVRTIKFFDYMLEQGWQFWPALRERIIRTLAREGVLSYSPEPRSLAVAGGAGGVEG
jgi:hypothetical protein